MRPVAMWGVSESQVTPWGRFLVIFFGYSLFVYIIGTVMVSRFPWMFARVDLMVAVCVEVAGRFPPPASILWCFLWGYVGDVFQGRLWGLHCATYLTVVYLHRLWRGQMNVQSLGYGVLLVGLGVVLQGLAAAAIVGPGFETTAVIMTTVGQAVFSMMISPLVMGPIRWVLSEKNR